MACKRRDKNWCNKLYSARKEQAGTEIVKKFRVRLDSVRRPLVGSPRSPSRISRDPPFALQDCYGPACSFIVIRRNEYSRSIKINVIAFGSLIRLVAILTITSVPVCRSTRAVVCIYTVHAKPLGSVVHIILQ